MIPARTDPPKPLVVLDFDTENSPAFYWYDEKSTDVLHTIAASYLDDEEVFSWQRRWDPKRGLLFPQKGYLAFKAMVEQADVVTCHNVIRHDVPLLRAYAFRESLPEIQWPRVEDTMKMVGKGKGLPKGQEYLADHFKLGERKMHVGLHTWERASLGDPEACQIVRERCESDVRSHKELYRALRRRAA